MAIRRKIGTAHSFTGRRTLHEIEGGFEMLSRNSIDLVRTRVFWEDVVMVTYHRHVPLAESLVAGTLAGLLLVAAILFAVGGSMIGFASSLVLACVAAVPLGLCLTRKVDVVTVFGRRSRVMASFLLDKRRAREVFDDACARVRRRHREMETELSASGVASLPAEDGPPAPPDAGSVEQPIDPERDIPVPPPLPPLD